MRRANSEAVVGAVFPELGLQRRRHVVLDQGAGDPVGDPAPVVFGDEAGERPPDHLAALDLQHMGEGGAALGDGTVPVEQHDADRRLMEKAVETLLGMAQRRGPVVLGGKVAHQRTGAQPTVFIADDGLADAGLECPAGAAPKGHVTALGAGIVKRRIGRSFRGGGSGDDEFAQRPRVAGDLARRMAEPGGQGFVDEQKAAGGVDE